MLITSIPQYIQGLTNAKVDLTTTDVTVLYTAPSDADFNASIINSIIVCDDSNNGDTITVTITDASSNVFVLFDVPYFLCFSTPEGKAITAEFNEVVEAKVIELSNGETTQSVEQLYEILCAAINYAIKTVLPDKKTGKRVRRKVSTRTKKLFEKRTRLDKSKTKH